MPAKLKTPQNQPSHKQLIPSGHRFPLPVRPAPKPPAPPPACIAPRRRFIQRFLIVCGGFCLLGILIHCAIYGINWPNIAQTLFLGAISFGVLYIPGRTRRGTFLQLLCLLTPFFITLAAVYGCWFRPMRNIYDGCDLFFGMCLFSLFGIMFLYIPLYILHLLIKLIGILRK